MNIVRGWMNPLACLRGIGLTLLAMGIFCPLTAMSQVPPRFYWKTLSGANAVPLIVTSMSGNTNPFDAAHTVTPGADFEGTLALAGYARTFTLFDRAAMGAVLLPMGRISGDVITAGGRAGLAVGERLRRPDRGVQPQPDRPEGAEDHSGRHPLRTGLFARRAGGPRHPDR